MRKFKMLVVAAVMAMAVTSVAASSAFAVTWRPQGTAVTATSSNSRLTDASGNTVSCTTSTTRLRATGDTATATAPSGAPVDYSGCTNNLGLSPTTVVTAGTWTFQAITTTRVDATATGSNVATITLGGFCSIRVAGTSIANNGWVNGSNVAPLTPSVLTINSSVTFPLTSSGCLGLVRSPGTLAGDYSIAAGGALIG